MAEGTYIDLKNVSVYFRDGYSKTGAVNLLAGYSAGATTMLVDGFTGIVDTNTIFTVVGSTAEYLITATVETTGNTTSITFTPGLLDAVIDNAVITVAGHQMEVVVGEGNLTYSEKVAREFKKNRGKLDKVRNGDETEMDLSFTFAWFYLRSATGLTVPTPYEFLKKIGPAANFVSTNGACEPYGVNVILKNVPLLCDGVTTPVEKIVFPKFLYEDMSADPKAGTLSVSGKCNALEPTITRLAA